MELIASWTMSKKSAIFQKLLKVSFQFWYRNKYKTLPHFQLIIVHIFRDAPHWADCTINVADFGCFKDKNSAIEAVQFGFNSMEFIIKDFDYLVNIL